MVIAINVLLSDPLFEAFNLLLKMTNKLFMEAEQHLGVQRVYQWIQGENHCHLILMYTLQVHAYGYQSFIYYYPQMQNVSDLQKPLADLSHNIRTFPLKNTIGMYMQTDLFVCKFTVNSGDRSILLLNL